MSDRNQPFDRHTFIDEQKAIEAAFAKGTWFVMGKDGEGIVEEPIPESIKATGKIPKGYALGESSYFFCFPCLFTMIAELDHALDPSTVIAGLAKINITTLE
jgi:hypothetical protein